MIKVMRGITDGPAKKLPNAVIFRHTLNSILQVLCHMFGISIRSIDISFENYSIASTKKPQGYLKYQE